MASPLGEANHMARLINSTGLVLDILGALLLWRYGLPPSIDRL